MESAGEVQESKVVVGLDFGTTFSGFAYALRADPDTIYTFSEWPMQAEAGRLPNCKTQTSLLYAWHPSATSDDPFELLEWGWPAYVKYKSSNASVADPVTDASVSLSLDMLSLPGGCDKPLDWKPGHSESSGIEYFLTLFKLYLASEDSSTSGDTMSKPALPPGMTARRAITDYLCQISKFILQVVRNEFGSHDISLDDIEWCLTVPSIWDEHAKKEMRICSELAGLVQGPVRKGDGSPHPLKLFIEPEAASVYCQWQLQGHEWRKGDMFLVVDCGGGKVELVLHEKLGPAPSLWVREVQESSGGLCGGSRVDEELFRLLRRRINCFKKFEREYPATVLAFLQDWEKIKHDYTGEMKDHEYVELPPKLATMWAEEDSMSRRLCSYDKLVLTVYDMRIIVDLVVDRILRLISKRMAWDLQAVMVVGEFSASPYLMSRIRDTFGSRVDAIVSPPDPGSAVCCGAVTMGIRSDTVVSRISKKTYGVGVAIPFISGVHPESSKIEGSFGRIFNNDGFFRLVGKGYEVNINDWVEFTCSPVTETQTVIGITLYSSDRQNVEYVTDSSVQMEGEFTIECPIN